MNAATDINLVSPQTGIPLVQLGPGGTYTTSFLPRGSRLLAVDGGRFDATASADNRADINSGHAGGNPYFARRQLHHPAADAQPKPARRSTLIDRLLGIDRVDLSGEALATQTGFGRAMSNAANHSGDGTSSAAALPPASSHDHLQQSLSEAAGAWLSGQMAWLAGAIAMIQRLLAQITVAECRDAVALATVAAGSTPSSSRHDYEIIRPRPFAGAGGTLTDRGRHLVTRVSTPPDRLSQFASIIARSAHRLPVAIDLHRTHPLPGVEDYQDESHSQATENSAADPRIPSHTRLFADDAGTRRRTRREQGDRLRTRRVADQKGRAEARCQQGTLFVHQ